MAVSHQNIKDEIKKAMKARDVLRLSVLRGLLSEFTNELVATKRKPHEELSDDEVLAVISRAAKQRKDSIEQFKRGGRTDLSDKETEELHILETYLPAQMARDEILKVAQAKKEELGIDDKTKAGQLMGAIMSELKNKADGKQVKEIVNSLFE